MHHWPGWARMIAVFNRACFSDTRTGVQVLSTTRARLKLLPRVIPFPACSLPFWQLSVLSPGSRHPSRTAPLKDVRPSHRHPCWLGRLPRRRAVPRSGAGRCVRSGRPSSAVCASNAAPYPPRPPEAICAPLSHRQAPSSSPHLFLAHCTLSLHLVVHLLLNL